MCILRRNSFFALSPFWMTKNHSKSITRQWTTLPPRLTSMPSPMLFQKRITNVPSLPAARTTSGSSLLVWLILVCVQDHVIFLFAHALARIFPPFIRPLTDVNSITPRYQCILPMQHNAYTVELLCKMRTLSSLLEIERK